MPVRIEEIGLIKDVARLSKGIDIVFICCPQTKDNLEMFNKQFFPSSEEAQAAAATATASTILIYAEGITTYQNTRQ